MGNNMGTRTHLALGGRKEEKRVGYPTMPIGNAENEKRWGLRRRFQFRDREQFQAHYVKEGRKSESRDERRKGEMRVRFFGRE